VRKILPEGSIAVRRGGGSSTQGQLEGFETAISFCYGKRQAEEEHVLRFLLLALI